MTNAEYVQLAKDNYEHEDEINTGEDGGAYVVSVDPTAEGADTTVVAQFR